MHNYENHKLLHKLHKDSEEYNSLDNGLFSKYISDNIPENVDKFNEQIEDIDICYINKV